MVRVPLRRNSDHLFSELQEAEKELSSFRQAVLKMYGPEEAQKASECWIEELDTAACLEKRLPWRHISVKAAAKLGLRLAV